MLLTAFVKITFSGYFVQLVITKNKKSYIQFCVPTDMGRMYCWVWIYVWTSIYIYTSLWMCFILKLFLYCLEYILYKITRYFILQISMFIKTKLCMNLSTHLYPFILHVPSQNTNVHSSMTFPSYMQIKLSVMTYLSQYGHLLQKSE